MARLLVSLKQPMLYAARKKKQLRYLHAQRCVIIDMFHSRIGLQEAPEEGQFRVVRYAP